MVIVVRSAFLKDSKYYLQIFCDPNVYINKIKMVYYDRIDVFEGINVNTASASKECINCYSWCFLDKGFKFQLSVYNKYHDVSMMSTNLNNIAVLSIRGIHYCYIIIGICKNEAVSLPENAHLNKMVGS